MSVIRTGGWQLLRSTGTRWAQVFISVILWLMVQVGHVEDNPNDRHLGHAIYGSSGLTAIFSFRSVQVWRTSAVTREQFSISTNTRLASSR